MIFTSTIPLVKIQHCPPNHLGGFCCSGKRQIIFIFIY
nr:MAG TPA: hypothetical protein [Caudoviricetes sp.]